MMRLPEFRFVMARSLAEAAGLLAEDPHHTRLLAGGTDLLPNMKRRHQGAQTLVGMSRIEGLAGVRSLSRELSIGAMTRLEAIQETPEIQRLYPGLARAIRSISTPTLRHMGTLGGNLALDTRCTYLNQGEEWRRAIGYCLKEGGETCWVRPTGSHCLAISSGDSAPLLCALGARVRLYSVRGERMLHLPDLYRDDGLNHLRLARDEIITEVLLPKLPNLRATYWKLRRRGSIDFPILGVGVAWRLETDGRLNKVRIFLGGLGSRPLEMKAAQALLEGKPADASCFAAAGSLCLKAAPAYQNADLEAGWRRFMIAPYVEGALRELAGLPRRRASLLPGGMGLSV